MKIKKIPLNKFKVELYGYDGKILDEKSDDAPFRWLFRIVEGLTEEETLNVKRVEYPDLDYKSSPKDGGYDCDVKIWISERGDRDNRWIDPKHYKPPYNKPNEISKEKWDKLDKIQTKYREQRGKLIEEETEQVEKIKKEYDKKWEKVMEVNRKLRKKDVKDN